MFTDKRVNAYELTYIITIIVIMFYITRARWDQFFHFLVNIVNMSTEDGVFGFVMG